MFVKENIGAVLWENRMSTFQKWLVVLPGNEVPNLVKLYWWLLQFWNWIPEDIPDEIDV